ncbi:MAG: threonine--tRNA ligase [Planctomycetota bacterium]
MSPLRITLPDGGILEVAHGATSADVAAQIGPSLARMAIAAAVTVNGVSEVYDLARPLPGDCRLRILTAKDDDPESLRVMRHSAAHVMAEAICTLFPETRLVYGPPLEDGFYYDIDLDRSLTPDDFEAIEAEMALIIAEDRPFRRYELPLDKALGKLQAENNRYKIDNAERAGSATISFYVTGDRPGAYFEDLCRGPHLPSTGRIGAFKIRQVSRSHYRGDVHDQPLQRVYGTAFFQPKSLKAYLQQLEEAKKRDHRVIGRELDLFSVAPEVGSGLVLWHPHGARVRMLLEDFMRAELIRRGYQPVYTPVIGRLDLYRTSGHYPYYEDSQFPPMHETDRGRTLLSLLHLTQRAAQHAPDRREAAMPPIRKLAEAVLAVWGPIEGFEVDAPAERMITVLQRALESEDGYLLRPMNCPHHVHIYKSQPRSYRDLPLRLAEFGTVHRYEQSGELGGMVRVRGFTQDDAHLFCTPEQLEQELRTTIELTQLVLATLDFRDYRVRLGLRDASSDKWVGSVEQWALAERNLRAVVRAMGLECTEEPGEAAFYGPKVDFLVRDCLGRQWQLGTVQVDYTLPERFDLSYVGPDNQPHRPIMIHRAPFGSLERFVALLIEHFAGAFPLWLAPVQVGVTSISEKSAAYAREVYEKCLSFGLRAALDVSAEKIGPKKHRFRSTRVPYILVVGEQEARSGTVNVNDRDAKALGTYALSGFLGECRLEIETKGHRQQEAGGKRQEATEMENGK